VYVQGFKELQFQSQVVGRFPLKTVLVCVAILQLLDWISKQHNHQHWLQLVFDSWGFRSKPYVRYK